MDARTATASAFPLSGRAAETDAIASIPSRSASAGGEIPASGVEADRNSPGGGRRAKEADFTFSIDGADSAELRVTSFTGSESISDLFHFRVELSAEPTKLDLEKQLGRSCLLTLRGTRAGGGTSRRYVNGIVRGVERLSDGSRLMHFAADIAPLHWLLTKRRQSRIFQEHNCEDMSVPGIVRKVFADAGLPDDAYRFVLQQTYEARDYVVQYRESDMEFVARLLENEGIFYYFEHAEDGHCMVLGDSDVAVSTEPMAASVVFREPSGLVPTEDCAFHLSDRREIQMGAVTLDDFDFKRPPTDLRAASAADKFVSLELSDYPGKYVEQKLGDRYAQVRLDEQQSQRRSLNMRATVRALRPGCRFTLSQHPEQEFNRDYLVTAIEHRGYQAQSADAEALSAPERPYQTQTTLLPADTVYRPPRNTPKPVVRGSQTAIVVGPKSEEIFTDEYGRVKVQFHWDRAGVHDEYSSCWIRVSQGMAGGNYGMMFLPRVGQEVIVDFLEGDPDRPIITGRVYNNDHMPPYALPDAKTISAIRTCTSKGAGGGNEIRFEDAKGKEQVLVYAHNSLHLRSRGNRYESVGGEAHRTVGKNSYESVKENKHSIVTLDLIEEIKATKHLKVGGDIKEFVDGKQTKFVNKQYNVLNGEGIWLGSDTSITLWCQGNFIKLDASGVTIVGKMVDINSGGSASVADPDSPDVAEESKQADTTKFGHNTRYDQAPSELEPIDPDETEKTWIEIELVDDLGEPVKGEAYEIVEPNQDIQRGFLDGKGQARVAVSQPGLCQISFPNIDAATWERI